MHEEEQQLADLLKQSVRPVDRNLKRDLWPQMLRRLDEAAGRQPWFVAMFSRPALPSVPWFDWALLAVLVISLCAFPRSIVIWLYHF